jgi:hypothetical protein
MGGNIPMKLNELIVLLAATASIWRFFLHLLESVDNKTKENWGNWYLNAGNAKYSDILSSVHSTFLGIFQNFFMVPDRSSHGRAPSALDHALWVFVVVAAMVSLSCSFIYGWIGLKGQLEFVLVMSVSGAFVATGGLTIQRALRPLESLPRAVIFIAIAVLTFVAAIFLIEWNYPNELVSLAGKTKAFSSYAKDGAIFVVRFKLVPDVQIPIGLVSMGILIGSACGIFTAFSVYNIEVGWTGVVAGILTGFLSGLIGYLTIVGWENMPAPRLALTMMFVGFAIAIPPLMLAFISKFGHKLSHLPSTFFLFIGRYRVRVILLASISSIALITLLTFVYRRDVYHQFVGAMKSMNMVYLGLNIIADSFSVIETHWILLKVGNLLKVRRTRNCLLIGVLLLLDLAASSALILVIPVCTRSYEIFPAIWFSGEKPWLGIFFWSTFTTSIIFYLFVVSSLLLIIIEPFRRLLGVSANRFKSPAAPTAFIGFVITSIVLILCLFF